MGLREMGFDGYVCLLFEEFRPKFWKSEYFFEEDIVFLSGSRPFIELIENFNMVTEVVYWFHL